MKTNAKEILESLFDNVPNFDKEKFIKILRDKVVNFGDYTYGDFKEGEDNTFHSFLQITDFSGFDGKTPKEAKKNIEQFIEKYKDKLNIVDFNIEEKTFRVIIDLEVK